MNGRRGETLETTNDNFRLNELSNNDDESYSSVMKNDDDDDDNNKSN